MALLSRIKVVKGRDKEGERMTVVEVEHHPGEGVLHQGVWADAGEGGGGLVIVVREGMAYDGHPPFPFLTHMGFPPKSVMHYL